jgi:hypothetical protein
LIRSKKRALGRRDGQPDDFAFCGAKVIELLLVVQEDRLNRGNLDAEIERLQDEPIQTVLT